ncbi:MAG TPA: class I SAM-dependent methyltransferase [Candidatus Saccharimonadales bacterium]|nr:class I SAM-dependent methyltransferase [Candidatus Saccharimonadales bacterium]
MPEQLDEENLNGLSPFYTYTLTEEERDYYLQSESANTLKVFGAERLEESKNNPPSQESVDALIWKIEELSNGPNASRHYSVSSSTLTGDNTESTPRPLEVTWNPAGVVGGFDGGGVWDRATASVDNLKYEQQRLKIDSHLPRLYTVWEGLYIDRDTGLAMIMRGISTSHRHYSASKPATADEVDEVFSRLTQIAQHDADNGETKPHLPIYLEVGYGLDPGGVLTKRTFKDKMYIGIDRAVGDYENPVATYPDAVRSESLRFVDYIEKEKSGQNIYFMLGDGQHLPFQDHSVREVFMSNILNADVDDATRNDMLNEARRVLEKDGNVIVRVNWNREEWKLRKMADAINDQGFFVFRSVRSIDPEYRSMEAQYGTPNQVAAPEGYYLIATPSNKVSVLEGTIETKELEREMLANFNQYRQDMTIAMERARQNLGVHAFDHDQRKFNEEVFKEMIKLRDQNKPEQT